MKQSVGVPPHPRPWPKGNHYDKSLLENGDYRNVEDKYRYWSVEAIKNDMSSTASDVEVAIENWQHDFNIGTIVRNANAFNVKKVHIIGKRQWNRRGAMVTDAYLTIEHHPTVEDFIKSVQDKTIIAVDTYDDAISIADVDLPKKAVFVFGGEGPGLSRDMVDRADFMIKIPQFGSTRSVNVGVASGIVLYKWAEVHRILDI
ncbi:RNA methyltransferase [Candidatus Saccharibacteria bacterium]|jgi:tRNA G18 (ribose-2'-O)-methylase SpoU|nr:RNA methyltransferase [Candidatus Saccharibacteria bacterium]